MSENVENIKFYIEIATKRFEIANFCRVVQEDDLSSSFLPEAANAAALTADSSRDAGAPGELRADDSEGPNGSAP